MNTEHPREFHHCWRQALGRDTEAAVAAERRGDGEHLTPEPAQCPAARRRRPPPPPCGVDDDVIDRCSVTLAPVVAKARDCGEPACSIMDSISLV